MPLSADPIRRERQLAALDAGRQSAPLFTSENNPGRGRTTFGATVREWKNLLGDCSEDELDEIANDPKAPASKRGAANALRETIRDRKALLEETGDSGGLPLRRTETETTEKHVMVVRLPADGRN